MFLLEDFEKMDATITENEDKQQEYHDAVQDSSIMLPKEAPSDAEPEDLLLGAAKQLLKHALPILTFKVFIVSSQMASKMMRWTPK